MPGSTDLNDTPETDAEPSEPEPLEVGWLVLDVVDDAGDWRALGDVKSAISTALSALVTSEPMAGRAPSDVCIALSDDAHVQQLNAAYRGKDKPTNVLSFPAEPGMQDPGSDRVQLGDVVFAIETVCREAGDLGIPVLHHIQHLAIHGVLHLCGYDHETDCEAARMEHLETDVLARLGVANPYGHELDADSGTQSGSVETKLAADT